MELLVLLVIVLVSIVKNKVVMGIIVQLVRLIIIFFQQLKNVLIKQLAIIL